MSRTSDQCRYHVESVPIPPQAELAAWLIEQARQYRLRWLLAHTTAGIMWGELRDNELHFSHKAFPPAVSMSLHWQSLQQARLFAPAGEVLLWHDGQQWRATRQWDEPGSTTTYLEEPYLLWGYSRDRTAPDVNDGFYLLKEGRRGIQHAPPVNASETHRAALSVRHYLQEEADSGALYIVASRLVALHEGGTNEQASAP